jgi:hypothetical protein
LGNVKVRIRVMIRNMDSYMVRVKVKVRVGPKGLRLRPGLVLGLELASRSGLGLYLGKGLELG